jgi:ABC-type multidrug transport system ATPase subunit
VTGAEVLVLDEPTTELDESSEGEILEQLVRVNRAEGRTILFAHHGLDEVTAAAETIAEVNHGRVRLVARSELTPFRAAGGTIVGGGTSG